MEAARSKGFQEGQAQAKAAAAQSHRAGAFGRRRQRCRDFASSEPEYFRQVEVEAVRLALSIARKVLHREAQMDPLLLAGVVRVALDQMQAGTRSVLRTSPAQRAIWAEFCSQHLRTERKRSKSCRRRHLEGPSAAFWRPKSAARRSAWKANCRRSKAASSICLRRAESRRRHERGSCCCPTSMRWNPGPPSAGGDE